jgi:hypothetical protein
MWALRRVARNHFHCARMILFNYYYYLLRLEAATPSTPFRLAPVIPFTARIKLPTVSPSLYPSLIRGDSVRRTSYCLAGRLRRDQESILLMHLCLWMVEMAWHLRWFEVWFPVPVTCTRQEGIFARRKWIRPVGQLFQTWLGSPFFYGPSRSGIDYFRPAEI